MITLLHGDNIDASRNELNARRLVAAAKEIRALDGRTLDATNLTQALESTSLFGGEAVVIIENLFGKLGKKPKIIESLCTILVGASESVDVILWEDKQVGVTVLKNLGAKARVSLFAFPVYIFQFLDGLRPGNTSSLLSSYHKLTETEAPELAFATLTKRVRQLLQLSGGVTPEGLQGWQLSRLTTQAKSFTMDKLQDMYKQLLTIEYSIKSGVSPFTMSAHIEQFILDL